jgi:hypothetical protein
MNAGCDGGGNRYSSAIDLVKGHPLSEFFELNGTSGNGKVHAGVCSIQPEKSESPWIVCPRRLLALAREDDNSRRWQKEAQEKTLKLLSYESGTRLGIWPEIKMKYKEKDPATGLLRSFDYTFDYVVAPVNKAKLDDLAGNLKLKPENLQKKLTNGRYCFEQRDGTIWILDFPANIPSLIEIMTSSTSGGNKDKRSTVANAFEDAILGKSHTAPSINYRQVWARMVSQLVVKSEVALGWGGKTIWVVQDTLVEYIRKSTALDLAKFVSEKTDEVNMLSFSYGDKFKHPEGVIDLVDPRLYAGKISSKPHSDEEPSFSDMIRTPLKPSIQRLYSHLVNRRPSGFVNMP